MTTAQEKLVVRVSLGAAAAASGDLPEPTTEQHWHWRRIAGAVLTPVSYTHLTLPTTPYV